MKKMNWLSGLRKTASGAFLILVTVIVMPVASEFFLKLAEEKRLFENPSQKVDSVIQTLLSIAKMVSALTETWWFILALGFFAGATVALWIDMQLRRRGPTETVPVSAEPEETSALGRQYVSPFAGKRQAPPPQIPRRLINVIDSQDEHINSLIYAPHILIRRYFEAHSPYIEIKIDLANSSVFELTYEGFQGRLFYRDDPIEPRPEIILHEEKLDSGSRGPYALRQFISVELRDLLISQRGQLQELVPSQNFCIKFSYINREDEKKEACWTILPDLFNLSESPLPEKEPSRTPRIAMSAPVMQPFGTEPNYDLWRKLDTAKVSDLASVCAGEDPHFSLLNSGARPFQQHIFDGVKAGVIRRADGTKRPKHATRRPGHEPEWEEVFLPLSSHSEVYVADVRKYFGTKGLSTKLFTDR